MADTPARLALSRLSQATLERVRQSGLPIDRFRGVAFFDPTKDERITSLAEFQVAEQELASIPSLQERYGVGASGRLTVQFIYELLAKLEEPEINEESFEALWLDFLAELDEPDWVFRGVTNVRYVASADESFDRGDGASNVPLLPADEHLFDLGDGVSIRGRSFEELAQLGFGDDELRRIADDWSGFGASSYVMLVEDRVEKTPENLILASLGTEVTKALRARKALRLLAPGDIGIGAMLLTRAARFKVGFGGIQQAGFSVQTIGSTYALKHSVAEAVPALCDALRHLATSGYGGAPGNLDLGTWRPGERRAEAAAATSSPSSILV